MARLKVLNPIVTGPAGDSAQLSAAILAEARAARTSTASEPLERLTGRLRDVNPMRIEGDIARIVFWANVYNALFLHRLCLRPVHGSMLRQLRLFGRVAYEVGDKEYSLNVIEHGVLRCNSRPPLKPWRPLRRSDRRLDASPSRVDPRIHFVLNCGARSCPPVVVLSAARLERQLEAATRSYLAAETVLDPDRPTVTLPALMRIYRRDFGGRLDQLRFVAKYVPEVEARLRAGAESLRVGYGRFDWTAVAGSPPERR